jgi:hypothetical protein
MVFLLNTIEYLNNCTLVQELKLTETIPSFEEDIKLPKDTIHLSTMLPAHRNRYIELKEQFTTKLKKSS